MRRDHAVAVKAMVKFSFSQKFPKSKTDLKFKNLVRTTHGKNCNIFTRSQDPQENKQANKQPTAKTNKHWKGKSDNDASSIQDKKMGNEGLEVSDLNLIK